MTEFMEALVGGAYIVALVAAAWGLRELIGWLLRHTPGEGPNYETEEPLRW